MTMSSTRERIENRIRRAAGGRLPESKIASKVDAEVAKLEQRQHKTVQSRQQRASQQRVEQSAAQRRDTSREWTHEERAQRRAEERSHQRAEEQSKRREEQRRKQDEEQQRQAAERNTRERREQAFRDRSATLDPDAPTVEAEVTAGDPHGHIGGGIHVRPAGLLAHRLKEETPRVQVEARGPGQKRFKVVQGTLDFLGLSAGPGSTVHLRLYGPKKQAQQALDIFREVLSEPLSAIPHEKLVARIDPEFAERIDRRLAPGEKPHIARSIHERFMEAGKREYWDVVRDVSFSAAIGGTTTPL